MRFATRPTGSARRILLAGLLSTGLILAACSAAPASGGGAASDTPASVAGAESTSGSVTPAFPATVDSVYGELIIEAAPQRIVALTYQVADILVSLGVQPVAVSMSEPDIAASRPWLADQLTGTLDPGLSNPDYSVNIERILSYQPDLIVGDSWQIADQATFEKLNSVAATYAGAIKGNSDWDDLTLALGEIVGAPEKAASVIADVENKFANSRGQLETLQGKTYQFVRFAMSEGFAFGNGSWLEQFGLTPAANQDNSMQSAGVSLENLDQLNADVLVIWPYNDEQGVLEADRRFQALPSIQAGLMVWADEKMAYATNGPGPLSLGYVSEVVTPILTAGVASAG
ncbi:MAG: ABC transporter substrate-binding protein [Nakamurella sp.]